MLMLTIRCKDTSVLDEGDLARDLVVANFATTVLGGKQKTVSRRVNYAG